jgi:hypothetical protein
MPVKPARLRALGAGACTVVGSRVREGRLVAALEWSIGTTVLERTEAVPTRGAARAALLRLFLEGRLLPEAVRLAREEVAAFSLREAFEGRAGIAFEAWLRDRIEALGFDSGEDLPLIDARDLRPELLSAPEREEIERDYPRSLALGGQRLSVEYDLDRRRVILRGTQGGRPPPRADFLPPWPGWSVAYHDGKHEVMLRDHRRGGR